MRAKFIIDRHSFAVRRMPGDGGSNLAFVALHFTAHNRVINLVHTAPGKLGGESYMRFIGLGDHQATCRFLVETMNDPWTCHAADAAKLAVAMMQ
jgi:hypothetical protein